MTPCPSCGNEAYSKLYITGQNYEDAVVKNDIYCEKCVKDRGKKSKKVLGIKIRGTSK
jgi:C4-type Zn-finger protein